jgi:large repetitive protein
VTAPRLVISALVSVAAMFVAMAWLPATALAQPSGNISIISAGPDASGDPYDLTIAADDANGVAISTMTAHVYDSTDTDVADVPMSPVSVTDTSDQTWAATTPIAQSALPPGTYTVTADVTDSTGESDTGVPAPEPFSFSYTTTLTVTANPSSVTYGSQDVTFSGNLTGSAPGGTAVPISGASLSLSISSGPSNPISPTTDSNGDFSYTLDDVTQSADYNFTVTGTSTYDSTSDDVTVNAASGTTTMTVTPSPPTVTQGSQDVTFTGTVQVTPAGGSATGIGSGVEVYLSIGGGTPEPVTTTDDANGDFTYTVNNIDEDDDYDFSVQAGALYTAASNDVTVDTVAAATSLSVTPSPAEVSEGQQNITFAGTVQVTPSGGSLTGIGANVPVDVSIGGATAYQATTTSDANGDFTFSVPNVSTATDYNISVGSTTLYTSASEDIDVPIVPAVTTVDVSASPKDVTFGSQSVTFTGSVTALAPGSTTAVGVGSGVPVDLSIGGVSHGAVTSTTDADGDFSYTVPGITASTDYNFSVGEQSDDLYGAGNDDVTVNANSGTTNVMVTANPPDVNLGSSTVTFSGAVTVSPSGSTANDPIGSGTKVYMAVGNAAPTAIATTDASGDFTAVVNNITEANDYNFSVDAGTLYGSGTDQVPIGLNQLNTQLTILPSQATVTEGSQDVTFTGTVTGAPPGSTTQQDIGGGVPINLSVGNDGPLEQVATTGSNSKFTYTVKGISQATKFNFSVGSTTTYTAKTQQVSIGLSPAETRITKISVSPAHLVYGQKATLTGTIQYLSGRTWTDLPRATVQLSEGKTRLATARAGANGSFSAALPTTHGFGWNAVVPEGNLLQQATATGNLSIAVPTKLQSLRVGLGVNSEISVTGCLEVTVPVGYAPLTKISIQYAAGSRGPWKTLGQLQLRDITGSPRDCVASTQAYFSGSLRVRLANAYYRVDFPPSDSFESVVSQPVHLWKYQTKITGYSVSPTSVKTGQRVTISGQLWVKTKGWQPFANQKVEIIYNDKGTSYWGSLGTAKTNSHGDFKAYALSGAGTFVAIIYGQYAGSGTDFAVRTTGDDVSINPRRSSFPGAAPAQADGAQADGAQADSAYAADSGSGLSVILQPEQLGFADAVQQVLSATGELTGGYARLTTR